MDMFDVIARRAEATRAQNDYVLDGLLYCGDCKSPKQCRVLYAEKYRVVGCQCRCMEQRFLRQQKEAREQEERLRIETMRDTGIADKRIRSYTFDRAEDSNEIQKARRYVEHFRQMQSDNLGLLFWGGVGTGKTFTAGCIANALIAKGISVMVTSIPRILDAKYEDRAEIISQLAQYSLVVLDDLGTERKTDFSQETVYSIIDARYKAGKPLIVTTNLSLNDLKNPGSMENARIYDRVLEMCVPILCNGPSRRAREAKNKLSRAEELLR